MLPDFLLSVTVLRHQIWQKSPPLWLTKQQLILQVFSIPFKNFEMVLYWYSFLKIMISKMFKQQGEENILKTHSQVYFIVLTDSFYLVTCLFIINLLLFVTDHFANVYIWWRKQAFSKLKADLHFSSLLMKDSRYF